MLVPFTPTFFHYHIELNLATVTAVNTPKKRLWVTALACARYHVTELPYYATLPLGNFSCYPQTHGLIRLFKWEFPRRK